MSAMQGAAGGGGGETNAEATRPSAPPDDRLAAGRSAADTGGGLLERARELEQLDGLVARARDGDPALALIEGPAGIGKTRLLDATVAKASAARFRILRARASDLEREFAFGVVRQLFRLSLADRRVSERWLTGD